jgi:hypothetical protein
MKRLMTFMMMAAVAAMVACTSETTEVAWINSSGSSGPINDIIWANGDQQWSSGAGYDNNDVQTESKEVNKLKGSVECEIDTGGGFVAATINTINGNPVNSLVLSEGSSEVFVLDVQ